MSKKNSVRYLIIFILGMIIYTVLLTGISRAVFREPNNGKHAVGNTISTLVVGSSDIIKNIRTVFLPPQFLIPNTNLPDGFTYHSKDIEAYPKLLTSFKKGRFDDRIQLLDIRSGKILKEWTPKSELVSELSYNAENKKGFDQGADLNFGHPLMLKDSSIIFQTGFSLVKINSDSEIEWINKDHSFHHSIEIDHEGYIYASGTNLETEPYTFLPEKDKLYPENLLDDIVSKIDPATGKTIFKKSILRILQENDSESLIYDNGFIVHDPIHLNDIQPALEDGTYWKKGDLLLSCRNISTIFIYRPSTNKIIWHKQGPWTAQHDLDFYKTNQIIVFGNDVIFDYSKTGVLKRRFHSLNGFNEIYNYNFTVDTVTTPYHSLLREEKIATPSQGRCDVLPNGDIFIEESDYGRIVFGDSIHKKITFARRIDAENITLLKWSRLVY